MQCRGDHEKQCGQNALHLVQHLRKEKKYKMCLPSFLWPAWVLSQLETEQEEHSDMSQIRQLVVRKTFPGTCGSSRTLQTLLLHKRLLFDFMCKTEPDGMEKPLCMMCHSMKCSENLNPSKLKEHF
ncbi:hypothetical protein T4D_12132 [Trichinella pseudospiralis]|uniref:Uncharacterized protein n=1 Tax=Trichinella pseudospiralis TaxID=6337 RepID=A0A0V1FZW2_TRIPS|nr:hypothetical protein T4D_12132 [Trichinella pseudospiralis]